MKYILITFFLVISIHSILKAQDSTHLASKWRKSATLNVVNIYDNEKLWGINAEFSKYEKTSFLIGLGYNSKLLQSYYSSKHILYNEKVIQNFNGFIGLRIYPNGQEKRFTFYFQPAFIYQNFSVGYISKQNFGADGLNRKELNSFITNFGSAHILNFSIGTGLKFKISETFFLEQTAMINKRFDIYNYKYNTLHWRNLLIQFGGGITF